MNDYSDLHKVNNGDSSEMEIDLLSLLRLLWRRAWLIFLGIAVGVGGAVALNYYTPPVYETSAELFISSNQSSIGSQIAIIGGGNSDTMANRIQILRSPVVLEPAVTALLAKGYEESYESIRRKMSATAIRDTDVIELKITGGSPQKAKDIADAVVLAYQDYSEQRAQQQAVQIKNFLVGQVEQALIRVEEAELAIRDFQQETGIIFLSSEERKVNQHIADLESRLMNAQIQLAENQLRLDFVEREIQEISEQIGTVQATYSERMLDELLKILAGLQATRIDYLSRGLAGSPEIRQIDQRIEVMTESVEQHLAESVAEGSMRDLLLDRVTITATIRGYENQITLLTDRIADYQNELWTLSEKAFEHAKLERDVTVSNNTYAMLTEELERARIAVQREVADVQIIRQPSLPQNPISPREYLNIAIGMVLGLMLSVGGIFTREMLDNTVKSRQQLEKLGIPMLGVIPGIKKWHKKTFKALQEWKKPSSQFISTFVKLESSLRLSALEEDHQFLTITSCIPAEGKSTTAANFSYVLALGGQKVLLIDGDARKPVLHKIFDLPREAGLTEIVAEQVDFEDAVHHLKINDVTFDFVATGSRSPNIVGVYRSQNFNQLIEQARKKYDWIIMDLPPLVVGSEALEVSNQSDGALLVIEYGKTSLSILHETKKQLDQAGIKILGGIMNKFNPKASQYGYNYYYEKYYQSSE